MEASAGPDYLRGEDLQRGGKWCEFTLTIGSIDAPSTVKAADGKMIDRPIVSFAEAEKKLIVGKTNERLIKAQLGQVPKERIGKKITVYPVVGNWFGVKNAIAVRVRISEDRPKPFISKKNLGSDITGRNCAS